MHPNRSDKIRTAEGILVHLDENLSLNHFILLACTPACLLAPRKTGMAPTLPTLCGTEASTLALLSPLAVPAIPERKTTPVRHMCEHSPAQPAYR